jgi:EAL domain-containing protein (putative c-di-GMP-specific phosphodiesterase class I)
LISLSAQLHKSLDNGEFELLYQPIFEFVSINPSESDPLIDARVVGAEALLRWNHPRRGLLMPVHFIDLLESMSLGERVGNSVVTMACDQLALWHAADLHVAMWINAFGRQVLNPEFGGSLRATLMQRNIDPSYVVVELLEREIARAEGAIVTAVGRIRQAGVRVAIDDFGTGHSSLARLHEVPVDILKVDRTFINAIDTDPRASDVVTTLSALARDFNAIALAEGVESHAQLRFALQHRYKYIQGYYLGLPMTPAEFELFANRINAAA